MKIKKMGRKMMTIMIVSHSTSRPITLAVSKEFVASLAFIFLGVAVYAGVIFYKHIDYWTIKAENKILTKRVEYFAKEILQAKQMVDNLKEMDVEFRKLLGLKNKKAVVQSGGPSLSELERITKYLAEGEFSITPLEFKQHSLALTLEVQNLKKSFDEENLFIKNEKVRWLSTPNRWPCYGRITSGFGYRTHPIKGNNEMHPAIDISAKRGDPIKAPADGKIALAEWQPGYGKLIVINHGYGFTTRYGHCSKIFMKQGQEVKRHQIIGLIGSTGDATGPHLHYEIWKNNKVLNPRKYLTETVLR
ncbi:MAG: M23 family metallopeptidase [Elusimicrobiota bacterium]